jgi:hypothetical protein
MTTSHPRPAVADVSLMEPCFVRVLPLQLLLPSPPQPPVSQPNRSRHETQHIGEAQDGGPGELDVSGVEVVEERTQWGK